MDIPLPAVDATGQLIDPELLEVIKASDSLVGSHVQHMVEMYPRLIALGWSQAEIKNAAGMGYSFEPHLRMPKHHWTSKYGCDARPFHNWVRHYYRRDKAEKLGMSPDEYITLWVGLRSEVRYINTRQEGRLYWVEDLMKHYMCARRRGLDDYEIRYRFFKHLSRAKVYLQLRRQFESDFVAELISAAIEKRRGLNAKYAIEAARKGASNQDILASVKEGTLHRLALGLREEQRGQQK